MKVPSGPLAKEALAKRLETISQTNGGLLFFDTPRVKLILSFRVVKSQQGHHIWKMVSPVSDSTERNALRALESLPLGDNAGITHIMRVTPRVETRGYVENTTEKIFRFEIKPEDRKYAVALDAHCPAWQTVTVGDTIVSVGLKKVPHCTACHSDGHAAPSCPYESVGFQQTFGNLHLFWSKPGHEKSRPRKPSTPASAGSSQPPIFNFASAVTSPAMSRATSQASNADSQQGSSERPKKRLR